MRLTKICLLLICNTLLFFATADMCELFAVDKREEKIERILEIHSLNSEFESMKAKNLASTVSQKISFDIKGMDVVDVIKMIANEGNLNVIIGRNVTGRVTMFLKDVDLWDALEIILAANNLAYEQQGEVISIMTDRDYEAKYGNKYKDERQLSMIKLKYAKAATISKSISQLKSNIGKFVVDDSVNAIIILDTPETLRQIETMAKQMDKPLITEIFELNYAKAEEIKAVVQEILTKEVGTLRIDARTNKIIITDYPETVAKIKDLIVAFDEKTPQVLIDAQIIEIKPSDKFKMGVDWDYWIEKNIRVGSALTVADIGGAGKITAGLTSIESAGDYKAIIDILRTIGETKILSSPRIVALNNQEAKILVGTKDAYVTSNISQAGTGTTIESQNVNFVDVGVKLYVTPTINKDGFITMKIKPEVSSSKPLSLKSGDKTYDIPIVSTSEAETQVMLKDGVTIIIAGLRKDTNAKEVKKLPLLGDIPLLGFLFRSTSDVVEKTELVIFLTPHIISGEYPTEYTSLTGDKMILDAQKKALDNPNSVEIIAK